MSPVLRNIPNILTISRIILAPIFFILFINNYKYLALGCFFFASVTDFLDGFLARKFNVVSKFGELYDPLADKFLIFFGWLCIIIKPPFLDYKNELNSFSINLAYLLNLSPDQIIFCILAFLLLRDLVTTTLREEKFRKDQVILKTNYMAKIKTSMLIICIHLYLIYQLALPNLYQKYILWFFDFGLYLTLVFSLISLIDYINQYRSKNI
jgi:phosphatidylglycerophosphate synthase